MREIRSLVLSRWRPHAPDGGAALRNLQNISGLGALGPVDVLSIGRPETPASAPGVRRWVHFEKTPARRLPGTWLLERHHHPQVDIFHHPGAAAFLEESLGRRAYDLVVIEEITGTSYLPLLKACGVTVVFDNHNVEAPLRLAVDQHQDGLGVSDFSPRALRTRFNHWTHGRRMIAVERRALRTSDMVWACSTVDADELTRLYGPCAPVRVVPNAVDVAALAPARKARTAPEPGAPIELVYVGGYGYYPNEEAALRLGREVLAALRARGARSRVSLVGRNPTAAMRALAAADPDVTVTGVVESIVPYVSGAAILAVPIAIGSGTRFKILEAFASGCPVVSTSKGAEGIAAGDGTHLLLRETPDAFAEAIIGLRADPAAVARMTEAAFALVCRQYSWEASARDIAGSLAEIKALVD